MTYTCKQCGAALTPSPEREAGDWFIRCLVCGAKNIVVATLAVIGWRE